MAAINQLQLHPTAAALNGAARLAHRGAQPKLMADAGDTLVVYNAWLSKEMGFGPNGEVGLLEEEISSQLANAVRPGDAAVDAAGIQPGVFTHGLVAVRWQQVWDQSCWPTGSTLRCRLRPRATRWSQCGHSSTPTAPATRLSARGR